MMGQLQNLLVLVQLLRTCHPTALDALAASQVHQVEPAFHAHRAHLAQQVAQHSSALQQPRCHSHAFLLLFLTMADHACIMLAECLSSVHAHCGMFCSHCHWHHDRIAAPT